MVTVHRAFRGIVPIFTDRTVWGYEEIRSVAVVDAEIDSVPTVVQEWLREPEEVGWSLQYGGFGPTIYEAGRYAIVLYHPYETDELISVIRFYDMGRGEEAYRFRGPFNALEQPELFVDTQIGGRSVDVVAVGQEVDVVYGFVNRYPARIVTKPCGLRVDPGGWLDSASGDLEPYSEQLFTYKWKAPAPGTYTFTFRVYRDYLPRWWAVVSGTYEL